MIELTGPVLRSFKSCRKPLKRQLFDAFNRAYPRPPKRTKRTGNGVLDGYPTTSQEDMAAYDRLPRKMRAIVTHTMYSMACETINGTGRQIDERQRLAKHDHLARRH